MRLGSQENITKEMATNKGRNKYYLLPLILGLIGLFFHYNNHNKDAFVITLLFLSNFKKVFRFFYSQ